MTDPLLWRHAGAHILDNYYTRMLSGRHARCTALGGLDPHPVHGALGMALSNLASMDVVLMLEEPAASARVARDALNWHEPPFGPPSEWRCWCSSST